MVDLNFRCSSLPESALKHQREDAHKMLPRPRTHNERAPCPCCCTHSDARPLRSNASDKFRAAAMRRPSNARAPRICARAAHRRPADGAGSERAHGYNRPLCGRASQLRPSAHGARTADSTCWNTEIAAATHGSKRSRRAKEVHERGSACEEQRGQHAKSTAKTTNMPAT